MYVKFEWDEAKRALAPEKHGVDFAAVDRFDWSGPTREDRRTDYGERRFVATGRSDGRVHVLCWTERPGVLRVISLRKANPREEARHEREEELRR